MRNWKKAKPTTLRKVQRLFRIAKRLRPVDFNETLNEMRRMDAQDRGEKTYSHLHPTKGYKKRSV